MATKTQLKSPAEFADIRDWRAYVRANAPGDDVEYVLARGRTTLYLRFYELRNLPLPETFRDQLLQLDMSSSPDRTRELEALNGRVFSDMTQLLFTLLPPSGAASESVVPTTPSEIVQDLRQHLEQENPFFAVWTQYQTLERAADACSWDEFAGLNCPSSIDEDLEFTRLMAQLGRLLWMYQERDLQLPPRTRYSIWFLHWVEHPIRNAQTRALLGTLLGGLETCGSA